MGKTEILAGLAGRENMTETITLTDFQTDALKEVGNIGIGHATTSLSQMVNKRVWISLPDLKLVPLMKVPMLLRNEEPVVGIILELKGDTNGFYFCYQKALQSY
jgi:chemotaxis protein CheC